MLIRYACALVIEVNIFIPLKENSGSYFVTETFSGFSAGAQSKYGNEARTSWLDDCWPPVIAELYLLEVCFLVEIINGTRTIKMTYRRKYAAVVILRMCFIESISQAKISVIIRNRKLYNIQRTGECPGV
jgi:hypothetical protein